MGIKLIGSIFGAMLKRWIISLMVCMAFVVLQVHNLMPHQHHTIAEKPHSHHHDANHHHAHSEDDHSETPIPGLNHSEDFEKSIIQPKTSHEATADLECPVIELSAVFQLLLTTDNPTPDIVFLKDRQWLPPQFSLTSFSHRGPPAFIV